MLYVQAVVYALLQMAHVRVSTLMEIATVAVMDMELQAQEEIVASSPLVVW
jgi:hypothetical protein